MTRALAHGKHYASVLTAAISEAKSVGNLTIRNLDDHVIDQLKEQAKANHRSLEGEIRHVLTERVDRRLRIGQFRERTRAIAALTAGTPQADSVFSLREDRDR